MPKIKLKLNGPRRPGSSQSEPKSTTESNSPVADDANVVVSRPSTRGSSAMSTSQPMSPPLPASGEFTLRKKSTSQATSTPEDSIKITQQKMATVGLSNDSDNDSALTDIEDLEQEINARATSSMATKAPSTTRSAASKGKAPVRGTVEQADGDDKNDSETIDAVSLLPCFELLTIVHRINSLQNDAVEEYQFSEGSDKDEEEDNEHETDFYKPQPSDNAVIVIPDDEDDDKDENPDWRLADPPWKDPGFDVDMRKQWEYMYTVVTDYPMQGDWGVTEDYQREKDEEMLRYVRPRGPSFPVKWLTRLFQVHKGLPCSTVGNWTTAGEGCA